MGGRLVRRGLLRREKARACTEGEIGAAGVVVAGEGGTACAGGEIGAAGVVVATNALRETSLQSGVFLLALSGRKKRPCAKKCYAHSGRKAMSSRGSYRCGLIVAEVGATPIAYCSRASVVR